MKDSSKFKITKIKKEKMTWIVLSDSERIYPQLLEIDSPYGNFKLGLRPEGFHGWAFKPGKYGSMIIPWTKDSAGDIWVGMVFESRPNMGPDKVWCTLGGFIDEGESSYEAQKREAKEEGGLDATKANKLDGLPINSDRMYFETNPYKEEGMSIYEMKVNHESLLEVDKGKLQFKKELNNIKHESELYFIPWKEATLLSADSITISGIARLLSKIL